MSSYKPMSEAPKDGTWILIRGRNAAGYPMIPVVCAWRHGLEHGSVTMWRDSSRLADMMNLIADVPHGSEADWAPLPD